MKRNKGICKFHLEKDFEVTGPKNGLEVNRQETQEAVSCKETALTKDPLTKASDKLSVPAT